MEKGCSFAVQVAFQIRNLKRRTIEQLVDSEEKLLHTTRYYSRSDDPDASNGTNANNNNSRLSERQSPFITPQHLTRIPRTSILDHQQVRQTGLFSTHRSECFPFSSSRYGIGYRLVWVSLNLCWFSLRNSMDSVFRRYWTKSTRWNIPSWLSKRPMAK